MGGIMARTHGISHGRASTAIRRLAVLLPLLVSASCAGLRFKNLEAYPVTGARAASFGATPIALRFEVLDANGHPLTHLSKRNFAVFEDGVRSTSEAVAEAIGDVTDIDVTLLLDDSRSMYEAKGTPGTANAVVALKNAAQGFMEEMRSNTRARFRFHLFRFANTVEEIDSLDLIPDRYVDRGQHFTSLYHAILEASRSYPRSILVLFSDGADNYSQNHGIKSLSRLSSEIESRRIAVHAIGFGNLDREFDRKGIPAKKALRAIARYGSLRYAADSARFREIFQDIGRRITAIYTLTYYSPNRSGRHSLVLRVDDGRRKGESRPLFFRAFGEGRPTEASTSPIRDQEPKQPPRGSGAPKRASTGRPGQRRR